jgi:hypothetical protein
MLCVHLPISVGSYLVPAETYRELWKTPKYIDETTLLLSLGCILAFLVGYFANVLLLQGAKSRSVNIFEMTDSRKQFLVGIFEASLALTLFGMAVWFALAIKRGLSPSHVLLFLQQQSGASFVLRRNFFRSVPGLTTCTQFAMAAVSIGTCAYVVTRHKMLGYSVLLILFVDAVRSFLLSERLALMEVAVPLTVIWIHLVSSRADASQCRKLLLNLAPALGIAGMYILFTVSEAFRSWTFYSKEGGSLLSFGATRLLGYYSTALNNSALFSKVLDRPGLPYLTQEWLWHMPLVGDVGGSTSLIMGFQYGTILKGGGNPEFNNPGGLLLPILDYGVTFGLLYWCIFGFAIATVYRSFKRYEVLGLFLYPIIFVGLLEISRSMYLTDGRTFPSLVFLGLAVILCSRRTLAASWKKLRTAQETNPRFSQRFIGTSRKDSAEVGGAHTGLVP